MLSTLRTYTMDDIGELIPGATRGGIAKAIERGLPARKIGNRWYFDGEAVQAWLAKQEKATRRDRSRAHAVADPSTVPDEIGGDE